MRIPPARSVVAVALGVVVLAAGCSSNASSSGSPSTTAPPSVRSTTSAAATPSNVLAVAAVREPLTSNRTSPVAHDTETIVLVDHAGRLFAATGQWEYNATGAAGQVLVKSSPVDPWRVFEQTQSVRVEALDSFAIPTVPRQEPGHSLLVAQAIVNGRSEIQWLLDGAPAFAPADSYPLASTAADVRAFGAHEAGGVWSVYAGVAPTGILRGTWSPTARTLVFDPSPELVAAPPGSPGLKTQKVTGFADCGGALYASINTKLFRRNDGELPPRVARWVLVYQEPPVGAFNSGLRGLTCVSHHGSPALLFSTEGNGDVYRIDHLPSGRLDEGPAGDPSEGGRLPSELRPVRELAPIPLIRSMLATHGTVVPTTGKGAIAYVIAAYNNGDFQTVELGGAQRQVVGFEWSYAGACPATRTCGPVSFHTVHFDATACFLIRTDAGATPSYAPRCLSGPTLTPAAPAGDPIRSGQAFVSIRTIVPSPFGDSRLYFGGYDCNFYPADGTAWIATSPLDALDFSSGGAK